MGPKEEGRGLVFVTKITATKMTRNKGFLRISEIKKEREMGFY